MCGILKMLEPIDHAKIRTFTFDNGTEFFYHRWLTDELPVKVYFVALYISGQRGASENTHGLLRQYFPKTMNYRYLYLLTRQWPKLSMHSTIGPCFSIQMIMQKKLRFGI
jgi:hypothetical protein